MKLIIPVWKKETMGNVKTNIYDAKIKIILSAESE